MCKGEVRGEVREEGARGGGELARGKGCVAGLALNSANRLRAALGSDALARAKERRQPNGRGCPTLVTTLMPCPPPAAPAAVSARMLLTLLVQFKSATAPAPAPLRLCARQVDREPSRADDCPARRRRHRRPLRRGRLLRGSLERGFYCPLREEAFNAATAACEEAFNDDCVLHRPFTEPIV